MSHKHIKWPSITSFHNVRKATKSYPHVCNDKFSVTYRGKVKLHGTNACVQLVKTSDDSEWSDLPSLDVVAQSRSNIITTENDNQGFARWVASNNEAWQTRVPWRAITLGTTKDLIHSVCYFGEWCGPGVNDGAAIHKIASKVFAVFAVMIVLEVKGEFCYEFYSDPDMIKNCVPSIDGVHVLPWHGNPVVVNWSLSADDLQPVVDDINKVVNDVEAVDPWVKENFDVEGIGEGLVYFPVSPAHYGPHVDSRDAFSNLGFKAKGEKHKVVKTKKAVQVDPEVVASVSAFVELVVTGARLEQGVTEACAGLYETKKIGPFIGWVSKDVSKECQDELEVSGLAWKDVAKAVTTKARQWYMYKIDMT